ncbi:MAG: leucine-rich repeat domain-containing protein [Oscillospiraceae bacterium]|nr:leucine-rich repeat domain-containing protein [Oscillospiraceae bacterium]
MSLGNFIMGALVTQLISDAVKKNREKSQNSPEMFYEKKNDGSIRNNDRSYVLKPDSSGIIHGKDKIFRLHPVPPCKDIPDNFTPYEGADMTCAEADAAGFEFKCFDRYHGVDFCLSEGFLRRKIDGKFIYVNRWQCNSEGIPGCVITGWHGKDETVRVPCKIDGRPVLRIEKGVFREKNIREIYLPDCLLEIGDNAFEKCPALTRARLSKELISIGIGAFWQCDRLENVYLGNVRYIGTCAFGCCSALREIRLPDMVEYIGNRAFADSGIEKMCWNIIFYAGDHILSGTPFWKQHFFIVLGDRIQKCYFRTDGEILIEDPGITCVGDRAFVGAQAEKITFSDRVR